MTNRSAASQRITNEFNDLQNRIISELHDLHCGARKKWIAVCTELTGHVRDYKIIDEVNPILWENEGGEKVKLLNVTTQQIKEYISEFGARSYLQGLLTALHACG